jgi:hypothetical protein
VPQVLSSSCYRYSVAGNGIADVHSTRVVAVWGTFDDQTPVPPAPDRAAYCAAHPNVLACEQCPSGVNNAEISTNALYSVVNVATLEFVNLVDIGFRCAPQTRSGNFPMPTSSPVLRSNLRTSARFCVVDK